MELNQVEKDRLAVLVAKEAKNVAPWAEPLTPPLVQPLTPPLTAALTPAEVAEKKALEDKQAR